MSDRHVIRPAAPGAEPDRLTDPTAGHPTSDPTASRRPAAEQSTVQQTEARQSAAGPPDPGSVGTDSAGLDSAGPGSAGSGPARAVGAGSAAAMPVGVEGPEAGQGGGEPHTGLLQAHKTASEADPAGPVYRWRVRRAITVVKAVGAVLFLAAGAFSAPDPAGLTIGVAGALVLLALVVRDLVAGVRLAADRDGVVVVAGYAGRCRLAWSQIERIRVDRRGRFGMRGELVELDAGETIFLFGTNELSAPCEEVVDTLRALRTGLV